MITVPKNEKKLLQFARFFLEHIYDFLDLFLRLWKIGVLLGFFVVFSLEFLRSPSLNFLVSEPMEVIEDVLQAVLYFEFLFCILSKTKTAKMNLLHQHCV